MGGICQSNASLEQKVDSAPHSSEQTKGGQPQPSKPKAAVNVSAPQTAIQHPQPQRPKQTPPPSPRQTSQHQRSSAPLGAPGSFYPPYRYQCLLCPNYHPLHVCKLFMDMSVSQRKDHVKDNHLCWNWLKAGHTTS